MEDSLKSIAQNCLHAAETDAMTFPKIVGTLMQAGFEGYAIDFRRRAATYYPPGADPIELPIDGPERPVAAAFDPTPIKAAIREAQTQAPGYSYRGFCAKVAAAGCAGYMVSFSGRRALYFGRTAETHLELFP